MEKIIDLKALLKHEIQDLYSAEEQIIKALPLMAEKVKDEDLRKALDEHLRITEEQKKRLDEVMNFLNEESDQVQSENREDEIKNEPSESSANSGETKICRGMQGLIEEGSMVMNEDMEADVMDAAIISCAQKIEHYEICGYGTARAYAEELKLNEVENLLRQTLTEEYNADDILTKLAVGRLNREAEEGPGTPLFDRGRNRNRLVSNSSPGNKQAKSNGQSRSNASGNVKKSSAVTKKASSANNKSGSKGAAKQSNSAGANKNQSRTSGGKTANSNNTSKSSKSSGGKQGNSNNKSSKSSKSSGVKKSSSGNIIKKSSNSSGGKQGNLNSKSSKSSKSSGVKKSSSGNSTKKSSNSSGGKQGNSNSKSSKGNKSSLGKKGSSSPRGRR